MFLKRFLFCFFTLAVLSLSVPPIAAQVALTVPLQQGTTLANVRYEWIASGVAGAAQSSGITQPDGTYSMFRISATPPAGAEEMIVYDSTDSTNWNTAGYRLTNLDAAVSSRSSYSGADTGGTITLLSRLTSTRATNLDSLDAAISTRSTYSGADTSGTTTLLSRLTSTRATNLDYLDAAITSRTTLTASDVWNRDLTALVQAGSIGKLLVDDIDAPISSRSTYAGADTSGTTTLLGRLTITRAGYLDNISVAPPTVAQMLDSALAGHNIAGTWGAAVTAAGNAGDPWAVILPGSYTGHQAGKIISRMDIAPYTAPTISIPAPAFPTQSVGYLTTRDGHGAAQPGVVIIFKMKSGPGTTANSFSNNEFRITSGTDGQLTASFQKGATYQAKRATTTLTLSDISANSWTSFTVPADADSFALPQILGSP